LRRREGSGGLIEPGLHRFYWESRGLPSGVYFLRMKAESEVNPLRVFAAVKKLILLK